MKHRCCQKFFRFVLVLVLVIVIVIVIVIESMTHLFTNTSLP